jgi:hypothetical protein
MMILHRSREAETSRHGKHWNSEVSPGEHDALLSLLPCDAACPPTDPWRCLGRKRLALEARKPFSCPHACCRFIRYTTASHSHCFVGPTFITVFWTHLILYKKVCLILEIVKDYKHVWFVARLHRTFSLAFCLSQCKQHAINRRQGRYRNVTPLNYTKNV